DAIRDLIAWAQLTSHRRVAKVAVIVPAERMNAAAANALLKTLEEPAPDTYLLLVTSAPGRIPATVRSRCRELRAPVPGASAARAWLAAEGVARADELLAQAAGAPLIARTLADPDYQAERTAWLKSLAAPATLAPATLAERIDAAPRETRRERLAEAIDWLLAWSADLAFAAAGAAPRRNGDHAAALTRLAASVAPIPLFRYHRSLLRQRGLVAHPLTPRLVAEALLTDYKTMFR
ncbi:MAG TPA: DNA polymerase III subunit delta', partial [Casimicrobiaceae bacterium]|nr:DNA polymerase III subunit delta' [Casimicrobiaceae bacterium]